MPVDLISLAIIALVAAACPILAKLIPGKLIPETVFLLIAGAVLGPNLVGAIELTDSVGGCCPTWAWPSCFCWQATR